MSHSDLFIHTVSLGIFYKDFRIVNDEMWKQLLQAKIVITNWHNLAEKSDPKKNTVLKRGEESNNKNARITKSKEDARKSKTTTESKS